MEGVYAQWSVGGSILWNAQEVFFSTHPFSTLHPSCWLDCRYDGWTTSGHVRPGLRLDFPQESQQQTLNQRSESKLLICQVIPGSWDREWGGEGTWEEFQYRVC